MSKILIAECIQEIASFKPVLSRYDDFTINYGDALLKYHRGGSYEVGGALSVFDAHSEIELFAGLSARQITSGGTLAAADFARLAGEFLGAIKAAPAVDAVYFSLHGAMGAENEDDPEGYLLAETRK